jgi:hypothetical protein
MKATNKVLPIILMMVLAPLQAKPCSFSIDYFDQVTSLSGRLVGTDAFLLHRIRWLRQLIGLENATLTLCPYCWPCTLERLTPVKVVTTDAAGKFDFGTVASGHYFLAVAGLAWGGATYQVEVKTDLHRPTSSIIIDASPISPDCTGGHEIIVASK